MRGRWFKTIWIPSGNQIAGKVTGLGGFLESDDILLLWLAGSRGEVEGLLRPASDGAEDVKASCLSGEHTGKKSDQHGGNDQPLSGAAGL